MKVLLVAINARFTHSNPAIYALKQSLLKLAQEHISSIEILEFNINQPHEQILGEVYRSGAKIVAISCYIWNRHEVMALVSALKKVCSDVNIVLGGPEVSYAAVQTLSAHPAVDFILQGEAELSFAQLVTALQSNYPFGDIAGLAYRDRSGRIWANPTKPEINQPDLALLPFPYSQTDLWELRDKIVYYESSRGCPYRCGYCLSAHDHGLRMLSVERVKTEISRFVQAGVGLVKFVDRTFNCNQARARQIWHYLITETPPETKFHFEIGADLLDQDSLKLLAQAPPGKFQFEIGVQSTNPEVLAAVGRPNRISQIADNLHYLADLGNIHLHLDLIAGLPFEDWKSFADSFDAVYAMNPHRIQLGFLKVLPGTPIGVQAEQFGLVHQDEPPYEILRTPTLSYQELWQLKRIEELVEVYNNTGRFTAATKEMIAQYFADSAFSFYTDFSRWWVEAGLYREKHKPVRYYDYLYQYLSELRPLEDKDKTVALLTLDFAVSEQYLDLPSWSGQVDSSATKQLHHRLAQDKSFIAAVLPHLAGLKAREISKKTRLVTSTVGKDSSLALVDYTSKDPVTGRARLIHLENVL